VSVLLVHSPLVGPSTWRWVADVLGSLGRRAQVPDLRRAACTGRPQAYIDAAASAATSATDTIVGHSGAGFFLPSIAARCSPAARLLFVDAGLPPSSGRATASADVLPHLRSMAIDGMLPPWSQWWGDGAMERLVPDRRRRADVEADVPRVPVAFYETAVTVPDNWQSAACGFVLLSESYRSDADRAAALGWPRVDALGGHLDVVNHPDRIAHALVSVMDDRI
jgi:hypothetical protein